MIAKAVLMRGYVKSHKLKLTKREIDALNAIIHFHDQADHQSDAADFPHWLYEVFPMALAKYDLIKSK